jgi:phosphoglycerate dehydrogenase-like enzyme
MATSARPRLVVLAPARLFRSFFDAPRVRRLDRGFRWTRGPAGLRDAEALVTTWDSPRFDEGLLARAPRLRVIAHCGGEVKGRFARPLFSRLTVTNAPAPMAAPVAELAVTLLLHAVRNVDAHGRALRRDAAALHRRIHRDGASDETLRECPVGLLGFGRIGREIARLLAPFGVRLLVHDPYVPADAIRRGGGQPVPWNRLLSGSRHLVLAAALTDRTRRILDADALRRLPDGAAVVNVARGGLVDLPALTREVRQGRLRCALDVTDPEEPLPRAHPLLRLPGAVLTPHVGAAQRFVRHAIADAVLDDLVRFFRGEPVKNRVTAAMLRRMT